MSKLNKYIAVFLLGIFCLPVTFQPLHVIWHNASKHHVICNVNSAKEYNFDTEIVSSQKEHCPICDFQLTAIGLPQIFTFFPRIYIITGTLVPSEIKLYLKPVFSFKTPRAPPALF